MKFGKLKSKLITSLISFGAITALISIIGVPVITEIQLGEKNDLFAMAQMDARMKDYENNIKNKAENGELTQQQYYDAEKNLASADVFVQNVGTEEEKKALDEIDLKAYDGFNCVAVGMVVGSAIMGAGAYMKIADDLDKMDEREK